MIRISRAQLDQNWKYSFRVTGGGGAVEFGLICALGNLRMAPYMWKFVHLEGDFLEHESGIDELEIDLFVAGPALAVALMIH